MFPQTGLSWSFVVCLEPGSGDAVVRGCLGCWQPLTFLRYSLGAWASHWLLVAHLAHTDSPLEVPMSYGGSALAQAWQEPCGKEMTSFSWEA